MAHKLDYSLRHESQEASSWSFCSEGALSIHPRGSEAQCVRLAERLEGLGAQGPTPVDEILTCTDIAERLAIKPPYFLRARSKPHALAPKCEQLGFRQFAVLLKCSLPQALLLCRYVA